MKELAGKLYEGYGPLKRCMCALAGVCYVSLCLFGGSSPLEMLYFGGCVAVCIFFQGRFWTKVLKTKDIFPGLDVSLSILFGTGFFCLVYCFAVRLGSRILLAALTVLPAVLYLAFFRKEDATRLRLRPDADGWLLVLLFFCLLFLASWTMPAKNRLPSRVGITLIDQDLLWNIGNARSFRIRFIPEDIRYSGVQLHYHYLTEMTAGALCWLTGISAYNALAFYIYPWVLAALVHSLFTFGKEFYEDRKKAMLFTWSMFLFGCAGLWTVLGSGRSPFFNDLARHLVTNINSQATAFIFLGIFGSLLLRLFDDGFRGPLLGIPIALSAFFVLCFSKGPRAAIVAIGTVITVLWLFVSKRTSPAGLLFAVLAGGMFAAVYVLFFSSGAATSMTFSFSGTLGKGVFRPVIRKLFPYGARNEHIIACLLLMAAHTFLMAPLQALLYLSGLPADLKGLFRLDGRRLWANSLIAGGLLAFYLFDHYAMSQVYFAFLALFFLHLLAVDRYEKLKNGKYLKGLCVLLAALCFVTQAFMYTNFCGSGLRVLLKNTGVTEKYIYHAMITEDDEASMKFLETVTDTSALFATNRIHTSALSKDGISNVYSALSGRQSYMEGYAYALTNMGVPYYVIEQRQKVNEALFSGDTPPEELGRLVETAGITHLVFSSQFEGDEEGIAAIFEKVYDSPTVRIYRTGVRPLSPHPLFQEELRDYAPSAP